ncbi:MAG: hypothetical protein CL477_15660 [Acidobacteria bacterium]|jgi:hypothetical protein|nr:hypothetical protein [Acidobacteriota bacterium]MDP7338146.1 DUF2911 domain-containing protein [Vicinamibacterales bacterium]
MSSRRAHLLSIGLLSGLTLIAAGTAAAQSDDPDGLAHTRLTLGARQITVVYDSGLRADDGVQAALLAAPNVSADIGVRVARLEGPRTLRVGPLGPEPEPEEAPASGLNHDLWLTRSPTGWALDARPVEPATAEEASKLEESRRIPVSHTATDVAADSLSVRLEPTGDDTGQLTLRWGRHRWATDFEFVELPRRPPPERTSNIGRPSSLTRDSDTSARWRGARLGTRNETAFVTPDGASIQVLFQKELGTDHRDFAALESTADGELVELSGGAVIRLRSDVPLRFGDTLIPTDNLAPNFPGSYGIWLKAVGENWRLVFNHEADSWGTQHDPAFDAAEIELTHTHGGPNTDRPLAVYLVPRVEVEGAVGLVIHWGQHTWEADFSVAP